MRLLPNLSLKLRALLLSLPPWPARFALLDAGGDVTEGIRALQVQLDLDPTNNKLRLRIVREYLTLGDRVSAASVAGEGGQSLPTGTLSRSGLLAARELLIGVPDQEIQARDYFRRAFDQDPSSTTFARRMAAEVAVPNPDWRLVVQLTAKEEAWVQDNQIYSHCLTALLNVGREQESRTVLRECFSAFQRQVAKKMPKLMISRYPLQLRTYFGDDRVEEVKRFAEEANGGALSWPLLNGLAKVKLSNGDLVGAIEDAKKSGTKWLLSNPILRRLRLGLLLETSPFLRINQMKRSRHGSKVCLSIPISRSPQTTLPMFFRTSLVSMSERSFGQSRCCRQPLNPQILDTLGTVHLALGDAEAAVPVLAESVRRGGAPSLRHARHLLWHFLAIWTRLDSRFRLPRPVMTPRRGFSGSDH